jgi:hypothetical protein
MEWVAKWLWKSYDLAFGCHHRNLSRVFTIERRTYRVCCSCGVKVTYSLASMSVERHVSRTECQTVALAARLRAESSSGASTIVTRLSVLNTTSGAHKRRASVVVLPLLCFVAVPAIARAKPA